MDRNAGILDKQLVTKQTKNEKGQYHETNVSSTDTESTYV